MARKIVITSGPGMGKTSVLEELARRGYEYINEAARELLREIPDTDERNHPRYGPNSLINFQRLLIPRQIQKERTAVSRCQNDLIFQDRSLADGIGYLNERGVGVPPEFYDHVKEAGYFCVFVLEPLPEYRKDAQRWEDEETARRIHQFIHEAYEQLGFYNILVPPFYDANDREKAISNRADFILEEIGRITQATDTNESGQLVARKNTETEEKYRVCNFDEIRNALQKYVVEDKGLVDEENYCLSESEGLLRIRQDSVCTLTIKGPKNGATRFEEEHKISMQAYDIIRKLYVKQENESVVYRKKRHSFMPFGDQSCTICLDDVHNLGTFVEIEAASLPQVHLWKRRLGITALPVRKSYIELLKECK